MNEQPSTLPESPSPLPEPPASSPEPPAVQPAPQPPKKSNTAVLLGVGAAIVLCCCCLVVGGVVALNMMGPIVRNTYETINQDLPSAPNQDENDEQAPALPSDPGSLIPKGGLGDETLRADTWFNVVLSAAFANCPASDPTKVSIEVLQQPDSAGVWKEKWTVACDNGGTKSFDVTFTPSAQGGTDIEVSESK